MGYSENELTLVYIKKRYNLLGNICVLCIVVKTITILLFTIMCSIIYLVHNLFKRSHCSVKNQFSSFFSCSLRYTRWVVSVVSVWLYYRPVQFLILFLIMFWAAICNTDSLLFLLHLELTEYKNLICINSKIEQIRRIIYRLFQQITDCLCWLGRGRLVGFQLKYKKYLYASLSNKKGSIQLLYLCLRYRFFNWKHKYNNLQNCLNNYHMNWSGIKFVIYQCI